MTYKLNKPEDEVYALYQHKNGELKIQSTAETKEEAIEDAVLVEELSGKEVFVAKTTRQIVMEERS